MSTGRIVVVLMVVVFIIRRTVTVATPRGLTSWQPVGNSYSSDDGMVNMGVRTSTAGERLTDGEVFRESFFPSRVRAIGVPVAGGNKGRERWFPQ